VDGIAFHAGGEICQWKGGTFYTVLERGGEDPCRRGEIRAGSRGAGSTAFQAGVLVGRGEGVVVYVGRDARSGEDVPFGGRGAGDSLSEGEGNSLSSGGGDIPASGVFVKLREEQEFPSNCSHVERVARIYV
jgi:hypothetical protein